MELAKSHRERAGAIDAAKQHVTLELVDREHALDGWRRWLQWRALYEVDERGVAGERRKVDIAVRVNVGKRRLSIRDRDILDLGEKILQPVVCGLNRNRWIRRSSATSVHEERGEQDSRHHKDIEQISFRGALHKTPFFFFETRFFLRFRFGVRIQSMLGILNLPVKTLVNAFDD